MNDPAPLIVTAELPPDLQAWADGLRRAHYPPERNRIAAHVTLFHALPPSAESELRDCLAAAARDPAPLPARLEGLMPLGRGTALAITSPALLALRDDLADRFHGLLTPQDGHRPRLHVTIQNKVSIEAARALQAELAPQVQPHDFRFAGLALHRYRGGPWEFVKRWSFRG
ncbi:2'-5' RNA ligase family protein [Altererythrobacter soli]|uniref:2'-5' RNA ligase family protein n=1 Tax=Croceibacterium soli TaxID=1739690 RepID=A0A6I4UW87_9SPHN|nr:2'-5' RNA ligase family protein [Croceibacterium soli]MXP41275.1 2'-5' RNA ligase family protein [Croceibacterium soli]